MCGSDALADAWDEKPKANFWFWVWFNLWPRMAQSAAPEEVCPYHLFISLRPTPTWPIKGSPYAGGGRVCCWSCAKGEAVPPLLLSAGTKAPWRPPLAPKPHPPSWCADPPKIPPKCGPLSTTVVSPSRYDIFNSVLRSFF